MTTSFVVWFALFTASSPLPSAEKYFEKGSLGDINKGRGRSSIHDPICSHTGGILAVSYRLEMKSKQKKQTKKNSERPNDKP